MTEPMAATAALSAAAVGQVAAGKSRMFTALTATLAITIGPPTFPVTMPRWVLTPRP